MAGRFFKYYEFLKKYIFLQYSHIFFEDSAHNSCFLLNIRFNFSCILVRFESTGDRTPRQVVWLCARDIGTERERERERATLRERQQQRDSKRETAKERQRESDSERATASGRACVSMCTHINMIYMNTHNY